MSHLPYFEHTEAVAYSKAAHDEHERAKETALQGVWVWDLRIER